MKYTLRWSIIILFIVAMALLLTNVASAKEWGQFDVTNAGQIAKVWEHTRYDEAWNKTRKQLNNLARERGVTFNEQGHRGTPGIAYEVEIKDALLVMGIGGTDYNHIFCEDGKCRSWSTVTISTRYPGQLPTMRHELGHVLSAPHHRCRVHTVMVGAPYVPCTGVNNRESYYTRHDKRDYAENRREGVYDDRLGLRVSGVSMEASNLSEAKEIAYFHSNADYVTETKKNGGTLLTMKYIPHNGLDRLHESTEHHH